MGNKKQKVIVAMSGGVDSSVAAWLLLEQGYEIIGIYMRLLAGQEKDEEAARKACRQLGFRFYPVNLREKFRKEIIDYFISAYASGQTPNPCVKCNRVIKFNELLRVRKELGAKFLATGHYIRSKKYKLKGKKCVYKLFRGSDKEKDQTYFLYNLGQEQLNNILFPLGGLLKSEVRRIADKQKLPYIKKESQDACFLNKDGKIIKHNDFLKKYIDLKPGLIKTLAGEKIGQHCGLPFYTIGQREGIEIGGTGPYYALKSDYKTNTLYVVDNSGDSALFSKEFEVRDLNWISGNEPEYPCLCDAIIRYRHKPVKCAVESMGRKAEIKKHKVTLSKPERAITPGQSAVFYKDNEVLGGGIIDKSK